MNRNQLKYFVAAAEHRSFTKAAEQFYLTQTAITQQIRLLEESLGCELFDRSTRPVRLTPAGQVFLLEARAILEAEQQKRVNYQNGKCSLDWVNEKLRALNLEEVDG